VETLALNDVFWLDGTVAVIVRGVVDDHTVEQFEKRVDSAISTRSGQLVVDLTRCRLASAGLAALVRLGRRSSARPTAARLVVTGVEQLRMLQIVGLTSKFHIYTTLEAAMGSYTPAGRAARLDWAAARPSRQLRPSSGAAVRQLRSVERVGAARLWSTQELRAAVGAGSE
jgi:anti-anti-sigma factor